MNVEMLESNEAQLQGSSSLHLQSAVQSFDGGSDSGTANGNDSVARDEEDIPADEVEDDEDEGHVVHDDDNMDQFDAVVE